MTLSEIREKVLTKLRENSSSGIFTTAELNGFINDACKEVWNRFPWDFRKRTIQFNLIYTTVSATSTGTSLNVSSVDGLQVGMQVTVNDGSSYENVTITAIDASGKILTISPGLEESYASGDSVAVSGFYLPADASQITDLLYREIGTGQAFQPLIAMDETEFHLKVSPDSDGSPEYFYLSTVNRTDEGKATNLVAGAFTTTSTVVCSALTGHENNYYAGWQFVNTSTHSGTSRVQAYNYSTKTLTLESSITGQTAADTFFLIRNLREVRIHPVPDKSYRLCLAYYANYAELESDYETPELGELTQDLCAAIVYGASANALIADSQFSKASALSGIFESEIGRIRTDDLYKPNRYYNMERANTTTLPGFYR